MQQIDFFHTMMPVELLRLQHGGHIQVVDDNAKSFELSLTATSYTARIPALRPALKCNEQKEPPRTKRNNKNRKQLNGKSTSNDQSPFPLTSQTSPSKPMQPPEPILKGFENHSPIPSSPSPLRRKRAIRNFLEPDASPNTNPIMSQNNDELLVNRKCSPKRANCRRQRVSNTEGSKAPKMPIRRATRESGILEFITEAVKSIDIGLLDSTDDEEDYDKKETGSPRMPIRRKTLENESFENIGQAVRELSIESFEFISSGDDVTSKCIEAPKKPLRRPTKEDGIDDTIDKAVNELNLEAFDSI